MWSRKIGHKIRQFTLDKVPYMAVVGAQEAETGKVNLRHISGESLGEFLLDDGADYLLQETTPPDLKLLNAQTIDAEKPPTFAQPAETAQLTEEQ